MHVRTRIHGVDETVEVPTERVFAFEPALGGFPELRRFVIIPDVEPPVEWLQSLEDPGVALALLEPFIFKPDYGFELSEGDAAALGLEEPGDVMVRCIVTLREDASDITANLLAPIVFSRRTHLARQVILEDARYPLRFPIVDAVQDLAASA